jgi:predicted membrane channel-forming protein YqfA (hemolysin III family)
MLVVLQIFFGILMFDHIMVLSRAYRIKQSVVGMVNGFICTLGYVIYGFSVRNHSKEYNYFITAQEYSIFRWSFVWGFVQICDQIIFSSKTEFYKKLVPFVMVGTIFGVNVLAPFYNCCSKAMWHWQVGVAALMVYALMVLLVICF